MLEVAEAGLEGGGPFLLLPPGEGPRVRLPWPFQSLLRPRLPLLGIHWPSETPQIDVQRRYYTSTSTAVTLIAGTSKLFSAFAGVSLICCSFTASGTSAVL